MLDVDPTLASDLKGSLAATDTTGKPQPKPPAGEGKLSQLWSTVKRSFSMQGLQDSAKLITDSENSAARGVLGAADQVSNTLMGGAAGLSKKTGAYKLGRTPEEQDAFLKWYDKPTAETNPLQFGEDRIRRWLGPAQGGLQGFIESASQFATGMALTGKVLPVGGMAGTLAKGSVTDMTAFDPHAKRLSNLVQNGPEWIRNPATEFLQSKGSDSEAYGRLKSGLEGLVLGSTIEALTHGLRGLKSLANGDPEAAAKSFKKAGRVGPDDSDVVTVEPTEDGQFAVKPKVSKEEFQRRASETLLDPALEKQNALHQGAPLDPAALKETQPLFDTLKDPNATPEAKQAAQAKIDELGAQGSKPYPEFERGNPPEEVKQRMGLSDAPAQDDLRLARTDARSRFAAGDPATTNPYQDGTPQHAAWKETYDAMPQEDLGAGNVLKDHAEKLTPQGAADVKGAVGEGEFNANKAKAAEATYPTQADAESVAASVNYAAKNARIPAGTFDQESVNGVRSAMKAYANGADPRTVSDLLDTYGVNVNYIQSPDEVVNTIKSMVDEAPEASTATRDRPQTHAEIRERASGLFKDMSDDEVVNRLAQVFGNTADLPEHIDATRTWFQAQANHVRQLARAVDINPENGVAVDQLAKAMNTMHEAHAYLTGTSSNIGRALSVHKLPVGELAGDAAEGAAKETPEALTAQADVQGAEVDPKVAQEAADGKPAATPENAPQNRAPADVPITEGLSRSEIRTLARMMELSDGDPAAMLEIMRGPKMRPPVELANDVEGAKKWYSYVAAFRINAMLSGPKTQITNAVNNAIAMLQRPAEYYWAGVRSGNDALKQQGADMLGSMFSSLGDSWAAAKKSWQTGQNVLDPGNTHTGTGTLGPTDGSGFVNGLNRLFNAGSRFLMSSDEFFKQMNYRANIKSQIMRQAREEGITDSAELANRLYDGMKFAFTPDGGAVAGLGKYGGSTALDYAKVGTFTNELKYGAGAKIQALTQESPLAKIIMPFVRTPVNIFRYAWERTPILNRFNKSFQEDLAAGGERAAIAQAKTEMGTALYTTSAMLALSGQVTGQGPGDPELRKQWKEAGNQPYSIKIPGTDTWMSYRRLDPTFAPLGLVADVVNIHSELQGQDADEMATAVLASILSNMSSKTFMQGVTGWADAMSSGRGDVVMKLLKSEAGTLVPNAVRQLNPDDTIRETRSILDEMKSRVPGWSETLEPRRNLFGEKVLLPPGYANRSMNPFTMMKAPDKQDVADELVKLGRAFTMPARTKNNGLLDLTDRQKFDNGTGQSPYDYMLAQMASPQGGMPSLRQRMETLVQSEGYKNASEDKYINVGGAKWNIASSVIQAYQEMAWARTLQAYPKLQQGLKQSYELQGASLAGGSDAVAAVMQKYGNNILASPKRKPKQ